MTATVEQEAELPPPAPSDRRNARICVIGASFGTGNLGVAALATGTISAVAAGMPGAEILLVDYARKPSRRSVKIQGGEATVETLNLRFSKKLYLSNNIALLIVLALLARLIPFRAVSRRIVRSNTCLRRLHESNAFLSLAGGDSFSDIYGLGRLIYVALPQLLAIALGRPLVLLPQTLGPFRGITARWIAKIILKRAAIVYSRDHASLEFAANRLAIPPARLRFSYDMAFAMEAREPQGRDYEDLVAATTGRIVVGINVSGLLLMGGYDRSNMFGLSADYAEVMSALLKRILEDEMVLVVLVPHVLGADAESDVTGCRAFWNQVPEALKPRVLELRREYDQQEIKSIIGRCDFFVGARMHACIAAVSQSVPAACLAYSRKFAGLLGGIGFGQLVVDLRDGPLNAIIDRVEDLFHKRHGLREKLIASMPSVKHSVLNMLEMEPLARIVGNGNYGAHK